MENLDDKLNNLHLEYRKLFSACMERIDNKILELKPAKFEGGIFDTYSARSQGKKWQTKVLEFVKNIATDEIQSVLDEIREMRKNYHCVGCGTCCKFAVSEFSHSELKKKAKNGDKYAKQFVETFVPYDSVEEAKDIFPEYIKLLEVNNEKQFYIYHCLKITEYNRCSDYENRPDICKDFPDNPVAFLHKKCGYKKWKEDSEILYLKVNAQAEVCEYYISQLEGVI